MWMYLCICKPFGGLPTLSWILNFGAGGVGLGDWGFGLGAWGLDLGLGLVLEGFGLEVYTIMMPGAICFANETCVYVLRARVLAMRELQFLAMCYVLCARNFKKNVKC